jgi:hypothetical protein
MQMYKRERKYKTSRGDLKNNLGILMQNCLVSFRSRILETIRENQ